MGRGEPQERRGAEERGQSLVELALIVPVILLLFLGIIDFSRLFHAYVAATNAARVGAEAASDPTMDDAQVIASVQQEASPAISLTDVTVSPSPRNAGNPVQIEVTYVFSAYTPLVSSFWGGGSLPLVARATSRVY